MGEGNIRVELDDGSAMVFEPHASVRIANRGPSAVPYKHYERISRNPPEYRGFGTFAARILAVGHQVETHRGLRTVTSVTRSVRDAPGDPSARAGR